MASKTSLSGSSPCSQGIKPLSAVSKWLSLTFTAGEVAGIIIIGLGTANLFGSVGSMGFTASLATGGTLILTATIGLSGVGIIIYCKNPKSSPPLIDTTLPAEPKTDSNIEPERASAKSPPTQKSVPLNDAEIIENLHRQGYKGPFEEGMGGRCLFLSIIPQLLPADIRLLLSSRYKEHFNNWLTLDKYAQADRFRQIALEEEELFLNTISSDSTRLTYNEEEGIEELYKDMLEELEKLGHARVRNRSTNDPLLNKLKYCKENFQQYKDNTLRPTNWAGTSEFTALGRLLKRQTQAFGQDFASREDVELDEEGNVLPYFTSFSGNLPPLVVFQRGGGGHYQRLVPPTKQ